MFQSSKIRVAVLRGGQSPEYDVSLKTGANVLQNLPEKYHGLDVLITKDGIWHMHGLPKSPDKILKQVDVVFNGLHGGAGEDGRIQNILQIHNVPFTGSKSLSSSLCMNKILSKELFTKNGLKTPHYTIIKEDENPEEKIAIIFKTFLMPVVVKPASSGSSLGVSIARAISELKEAIKKALKHSHTAIIEDFISGREATCGVIDNFRGEVLYSLFPVEIRPKAGNFFDYDSKYSIDGSAKPSVRADGRPTQMESGFREEICPGNFSTNEKKMIMDYAKRAHQALGLRHYSRSDFIITPRRGIYILETNSLPDLSERSLLSRSLASGGTHISYFLDHILQLALN